MCLLGIGLALGCDYPTAHMVISKSIPSRTRGRLVLSAFGFQAVGALTGTVIGYLILANAQDLGAWRWMYATAIIPAVLVIIGRFYITESPHWLMSHGRTEEAAGAALKLLARDPPYPKEISLAGAEATRGRVTEPDTQRTRLERAVRQQEPRCHHSRLGALVPPGSQHLRHRHFRADHSGGHDRPSEAACQRRSRYHP